MALRMWGLQADARTLKTSICADRARRNWDIRRERSVVIEVRRPWEKRRDTSGSVFYHCHDESVQEPYRFANTPDTSCASASQACSDCISRIGFILYSCRLDSSSVVDRSWNPLAARRKQESYATFDSPQQQLSTFILHPHLAESPHAVAGNLRGSGTIMYTIRKHR